jgi:hypothetical protein
MELLLVLFCLSACAGLIVLLRPPRSRSPVGEPGPPDSARPTGADSDRPSGYDAAAPEATSHPRRGGWDEDVRLGYAAGGAYLASLAVAIWFGPFAALPLLAVGCVALVAMPAAGLVLAVRLFTRGPRSGRAGALALVGVGLGSYLTVDAVSVHLIVRVYRAGGPRAISDWAQEVMSDPGRRPDAPEFLDPDRVPAGVKAHLTPMVSVGGTIWSDQVRVRMELGGGFYHYGVAVYPRDAAAEPTWWQRALDWPPEVAVYHEE